MVSELGSVTSRKWNSKYDGIYDIIVALNWRFLECQGNLVVSLLQLLVVMKQLLTS